MKNPTLLAALVLVVGLGAFGIVQQGGLDVLQGRFTTSGSELTFDLAATTPKPDILVSGTANNVFAAYSVSTSSEAVSVDSLSVTLKSGSEADFGAIELIYPDDTGTTQTAKGYLVSGKVVFSGLKFYIPASSSETLQIAADLNKLSSEAGGSAISGDKVRLVLGKDDFKAVGMTSGTTFTTLTFAATREPSTMIIAGAKPTLTLSSKSPSGARTVSTSDEILALDVSSTNTFTGSKLVIKLGSEGLFDTTATVPATLKLNGKTTVGTANVAFTDASNASITFATKLSGSGSMNLSISVDSGKLLNERSGLDDLLTTQVELGSVSSSGKLVEGGFWWTDGTTTFKWLGNLASTTLYGNTLTY